MQTDPRDILAARHREMDRQRIVTWSPKLRRALVLDGFCRILATARTVEEAERIKPSTQAKQLRFPF